jgi:hypothetical protein
MMTQPVRLQLSRSKGFNLQKLSRETNGLEAVVVARPSLFGNPFTVTTKMRPGTKVMGGTYIAVPTIGDAIECFREMLAEESAEGSRAAQVLKHLGDLRGNNLACWCKPGEPCHADVLLEIANR